MLLDSPWREYSYKGGEPVVNREENDVLHNKDILPSWKKVVINLRYLHLQSIDYLELRNNCLLCLFNNVFYILILRFEDLTHSLFYGKDNLLYHVGDLVVSRDIGQLVVYLN